MSDDLKKKIEALLPLSDWRLVRGEAFRRSREEGRDVTIRAVFLEWIEPQLEQLRRAERNGRRRA